MAYGTQHSWGPANIDSLLTTTRDAILKSKEFLNDAIFTKIVLLNELNKRSRVTFQGGASILVPIMYEKNSTFKAYAGDDTLDTTGQEGLTTASATWRNYGGVIKYAGDEIRMNAGEKLYDLAKAKILQGVMSGKDKLNSDMFASSQATKAIQCLTVLVDATSSVQGVNSTTYSWWQSQVTASGVFATRGVDDMRTLRNNILKQGQAGGGAPDIIITTQTVCELYEASLQAQQRYGKGDAGDASMGILFAGAPVQFDPNCNSGVLYMIPSENLEFVVHRDADWEIDEFKKVPTQDVYLAQCIFMGGLVTNNRRRLGKLTGITA